MTKQKPSLAIGQMVEIEITKTRGKVEEVRKTPDGRVIYKIKTDDGPKMVSEDLIRHFN